MSAQTHEYLSRLLKAAFPLNIQDRLQVKALLSVAFTITGRSFCFGFFENVKHIELPQIFFSPGNSYIQNSILFTEAIGLYSERYQVLTHNRITR
jgi:hypothetical protein